MLSILSFGPDPSNPQQKMVVTGPPQDEDSGDVRDFYEHLHDVDLVSGCRVFPWMSS